MNAERIAASLARARQARRSVLESHSSERIIAALSKTAGQWQDRAFAPRRRLLDELPGRVHLARAMIERGLDLMFSVVDETALHRLVADEARGSVRGPALIYHALSGNIPGLCVAPIVTGLLARSVCLIRDSARQPLLTGAFVETLADDDADLAAMVVADTWGHGREATPLQELIVSNAERIELYGSDATLAELEQRYNRTTLPKDAALVTHGTRLSVGVIAGNADPGDWARAFAEDVAIYDGLGCLSPHTILVEGRADRARPFVDQLARALDEYQHRWPRQHRDVATEASRRAFIDSAELAAASRDGDDVVSGDDDAWCIRLAPSRPLTLGPGLRCVTVTTSETRDDTLAQLRASSVPLAGVGLASGGGDVDSRDYTEALQRCGATLVCSPGRMQAPPIAWQQDGLPRLASLLEQQR